MGCLLLKRCRRVLRAGVVFAFLLSFFVQAEGPVLFYEDFENGLGGFLINNNYGDGDGLWHLSASCRVSTDGALYYGRSSSCDYDNGEKNQGVVKSPVINLENYPSGSIELRFMYFLETEGYGSWERDLASVEISKNGGGYVVIAHKYSRPNSVILTNQTTVWTECVIDLSDYAGSTIQLRFGFESVDPYQNDFEGFFVDDIVIYGPPCDFVITGDTNGDCVVDIVDLANLASNWLLNCYQTPADPGCVPK